MKIALYIISLLGIILFGSLFGLTYGRPPLLENSVKGFVKKQIELEIKDRYRHSSASTVAKQALHIANSLGYEEQSIKADLANKLPEKIAEVIASLCGYDCEKKKAIGQAITKGYIDRIANIQIAKKTLSQIIKDKYMEILANLRTDLRIFLGSNTAMFAILFLVSLLKPKAFAQLLLPSVLLLIATLTASGCYLFGQDWFYTILYNDYAGFAYLAYVGSVFGLLMDIAVNKARVTTEILNTILNALDSALSLTPC